MENHDSIIGEAGCALHSQKHIYFVQVNYLYGNTAYLPYAAGAVAAYAWNQEPVRQAYSLKRFFFVRDPVAQVVTEMDEPFLVAFSCYVWNFEYNKALARQIKARYPDCRILFGGHNVPFNSPALLDECDYIDYLIHEEGEEAFAALLLALDSGAALSGIQNLSYRDAEGRAAKNPNARMLRCDYPSPYLMGLFDDLFRRYDFEFSATLETNRGCPFHCAFCDWGTLRGKLRQFPMERVRAEVAWMAEKKIDHVYCADANYGIFPRDDEIVDLLIATKQRTGFPRKFRVCYTKDSDETVFRLNQKLDSRGMSKGATLSFQSLCPAVLENIGRKNLTLERFRELMSLYHGADIPSNSELILALPGESYGSFCAGVGKLLEAGQHSSLNIYNCELLPNAQMADPLYRIRHGIQSVSTRLGRNHCDSKEAEEAPERADIVCETAAMPRADWKRANLFALAVQSLHCFGPLQCFAIYCYYEKQIAFEQFYEELLSWVFARPETVVGRVFADIAGRFDAILAGDGSWSYVNPAFGDIIWPYEEGAFLEILYRFDDFYTEIIDFLAQYPIEETIFADLLRYQQAVLKRPWKDTQTLRLRYDLQAYFQRIGKHRYAPLEERSNALTVYEDNRTESWADYAREIVWYGRKGGKNFYTKLEVEYDE